MNIQLIAGQFNASDALQIITQMIQIKVKYHEDKITQSSNEEDIKFREAKIKRLQQELHELRSNLGDTNGKLTLDAIINIEHV
jgi:hypothetical protein